MEIQLLRNIGSGLLAILLSVVTSCEKIESGSDTLTVSVREDNVKSKSGYVFVSVKTSGKWTLDLDFNGGAEWAQLNVTSGNGENNGILLQFEENDGETSRTLRVLASSAGLKSECSFTQLSALQSEMVPSDKVRNWMELPATDDETLLFITHDMEVGEKNIRNYSYYWDADNLVARWVAYPLNKGLIGSGSRTDEWGLDPKLPRKLQPVLNRGYRGGYDRGHQLPSADRLSRKANIKTFYGTNMTPQLGSLNQNGWATLEGAVRDWAGAFDTLYVVTGCTVEGSTKIAYDNDGKEVTVPTGYYKALLGYQKNPTISITPTTRGYTGIAFYYPHEGYSGGYMAKSMTIDALEELVKVDFFVNLPATIGDDLASKVEATKDSWWK